MNKWKNIIEIIKERGPLKFIQQSIRIIYFSFYKFFFKKCSKIYINGEFQIRGKKHIEIGFFSAGSRIRIDAIEKYKNQIFEPLLKIGNNVMGNNDIHIACTNKVIIGDNVLLGSNIYITDHDHGIYSNSYSEDSPLVEPKNRPLTTNGEVIIGNNVFIGEYVTILKNVHIGDGVIIGANSLVSKNIPPYSIAIGNPAKIIKTYNFGTKKWEKI